MKIRVLKSDFDYDICASTPNKAILNGIYKDSLPVSYEKGTTGKAINTFEDLCEADMLAFGSKIGSITNKGSSIFAIILFFPASVSPCLTTYISTFYLTCLF